MTDARAVDKIGAIPAVYDTPALPVRRQAAMMRWLTIIAVTQGCAIAGLGFAFAALLPLQKVVPMVVTSGSKGDEIIRLSPVTLNEPTADYLTEISLRQYVQARYTISGSDAEQQILWGPGSAVQLMSTDAVYRDFQNAAMPEYTRMRTEGLVRSVSIASVRKLGPDLWQVEFKTREEAQSSPFGAAPASTTRLWVTSFRTSYEPKNVRYEDRLTNPLGFTISAVSDARRDG